MSFPPHHRENMEKELGPGYGTNGSPVTPRSAFQLRNRYLSRIGAKVCTFSNIKWKLKVCDNDVGACIQLFIVILVFSNLFPNLNLTFISNNEWFLSVPPASWNLQYKHSGPGQTWHPPVITMKVSEGVCPVELRKPMWKTKYSTRY